MRAHTDGRRLVRRMMFLVGVGTAVALVLPACSVAPSTLQPHANGAVTRGAWDAAIVLGLPAVVAIVVLFAAALRHRDRGAPAFVSGNGLVVVAGLALPIVIVAALSVIAGTNNEDRTTPVETPITVQVSAHQWWWGIVYQQSGVTTANQLTIPADQPVDITLTSDNVVHSFWVPSLIPATDVVPGSDTHVTVTVPTPGTYRGQCAQFCGIGHPDMRILVRVVPQEAFDAWQQHEISLIQQNAGNGVPAGLGVFLVAGCDRCHTIGGTIADGTVGPDLTDLGDREMLGANLVHNDPGSLGRWIADPSSIKPGVKMPGYAGTLTPNQIGALVNYLEGLR